jgi:hypothetical protein
MAEEQTAQQEQYKVREKLANAGQTLEDSSRMLEKFGGFDLIEAVGTINI